MITCNIEIVNVSEHVIEEEFLGLVMAKLIRQIPHAKDISIYTNPRTPEDAEPYKHPGFIEYRIVIHYHEGNRMVIGAIQRKIGAELEFHS